jgi:hypothetical protein
MERRGGASCVHQRINASALLRINALAGECNNCVGAMVLSVMIISSLSGLMILFERSAGQWR